jgi:hypothetical protein
MFGPAGTLECHYFGLVKIDGEKSYKGGRQPGLFAEGAVANIAEFHKNILEGKCDNPTVEASVRSNLTTILGRMAAYKKAEVTWDEMLQVAEKLEFPTQALKA